MYEQQCAILLHFKGKHDIISELLAFLPFQVVCLTNFLLELENEDG